MDLFEETGLNRSYSGLEEILECRVAGRVSRCGNWASKRFYVDFSYLLVCGGKLPIKGTCKKIPPRKKLRDKMRCVPTMSDIAMKHVCKKVLKKEEVSANPVYKLIDKLEDIIQEKKTILKENKNKKKGKILPGTTFLSRGAAKEELSKMRKTTSLRNGILSVVSEDKMENILVEDEYPLLSKHCKNLWQMNRKHSYKDIIMRNEFYLNENTQTKNLKEDFKKLTALSDYRHHVDGYRDQVSMLQNEITQKKKVLEDEYIVAKRKSSKSTKLVKRTGGGRNEEELMKYISDREVSLITRNRFEVFNEVAAEAVDSCLTGQKLKDCLDAEKRSLAVVHVIREKMKRVKKLKKVESKTVEVKLLGGTISARVKKDQKMIGWVNNPEESFLKDRVKIGNKKKKNKSAEREKKHLKYLQSMKFTEEEKKLIKMLRNVIKNRDKYKMKCEKKWTEQTKLFIMGKRNNEILPAGCSVVDIMDEVERRLMTWRVEYF